MHDSELVTVEFYGMARQRAGRAQLTLQANTLHELADKLAEQCPGLGNLRAGHGGLAAEYLLSLDGSTFVRQLEQQLMPGAHVLLFGADAGG